MNAFESELETRTGITREAITAAVQANISRFPVPAHMAQSNPFRALAMFSFPIPTLSHVPHVMEQIGSALLALKFSNYTLLPEDVAGAWADTVVGEHGEAARIIGQYHIVTDEWKWRLDVAVA